VQHVAALAAGLLVSGASAFFLMRYKAGGCPQATWLPWHGEACRGKGRPGVSARVCVYVCVCVSVWGWGWVWRVQVRVKACVLLLGL